MMPNVRFGGHNFFLKSDGKKIIQYDILKLTVEFCGPVLLVLAYVACTIVSIHSFIFSKGFILLKVAQGVRSLSSYSVHGWECYPLCYASIVANFIKILNQRWHIILRFTYTNQP